MRKAIEYQEFIYDLAGNITSITRPGERTTSYSYDQNYNQISVMDPKGYTYDFHGNLTARKATNGLITRFSCDILDYLNAKLEEKELGR